MPHRADHVAKAVAAQVLAAIPAGHDHQMPGQPLAFQHPQDDRARARLTVVVLHALARDPRGPAVVGGLGEPPLCGQRGQRCVETEHHHRIDPGVGEQARALVESGQAKGRGPRLEQANGMRIEGRDQRRTSLGARARDGGPEPFHLRNRAR